MISPRIGTFLRFLTGFSPTAPGQLTIIPFYDISCAFCERFFGIRFSTMLPQIKPTVPMDPEDFREKKPRRASDECGYWLSFVVTIYRKTRVCFLRGFRYNKWDYFSFLIALLLILEELLLFIRRRHLKYNVYNMTKIGNAYIVYCKKFDDTTENIIYLNVLKHSNILKCKYYFLCYRGFLHYGLY